MEKMRKNMENCEKNGKLWKNMEKCGKTIGNLWKNEDMISPAKMLK